MGQLIHVYGQVKAQGKLVTNDLYQFMNAGIPIIAELSKVVGKSETEIKDMVSAGKIGFPEVQAVIKNMTSEGGLFFNLMAEQSKSLGGQISNLQDNFDQMLNEIGKASEGAVSGAISSVSFLVENYQTLGKIIAGLITTYGAYRAAIIVNNTLVALSTQLTNGWTVAQLAQYRGLLLLEKAQKLLNATMLANPYIFMATAVAALGAAMFVLTDRTSAAEKAQKRLNEEREVAMAKEKEHKQHIEELIDSATNQYLADTDRRKALTELAGAYPQIFAKYDIESIKLADILKLKKEIAEFDANKARGQRQTDYSKNKEYAKILYDIGTKQGSKGFDEIAKGSDLDRIITEKFGNHWRTFGNYSEIYAYFNEKQKNAKKELKSDALSDWTANLKNQSEDELKKQLEQRKHLIADMQKQEKEGKKWASHGVKFGEEWYAFNKEELQAQNQAIQAQLDRLHEKTYEYKDLTKEYTQAVKDAEKALDNIKNGGQGKHSKEEFAKIIKEAEDNLKNAKNTLKEHQTSLNKKAATKAKKETLPEFDTEKANRDHQRQIQDDLFRQEEARIKIMQEGTEKRLAIIQLEYDKQEEEIRRRSQDQLAAFIETEKQKAEAQGKWKKGKDFDANTEAINAEKARLAENEKTLLASNAEYQRIQQEQVYKELLEKYQTYTDQRKAIEEKYNADIAALQAKLGADAPQVKKAQDEKARELKKLDILHKKEGTAIAKLFDNLRKKTVKEIRQTITDAETEIDALASTLDMSDNANVEFIKNLRQQIEQVRDTAERSDTTFGRLGANIKKMVQAKPNTAEWQEAFNGMLSSAQSITSEFAQLGQEFERLGQSTGNESLKNFANSINELGSIVSKTLSFAQIGGSVGGGLGAAIGGVIGAVYGIYEKIESNKERARQRERQWKEQEIQYEKKINDLRDQRILKGEKHTNPFTTDKIGKHLDILNNYKEKLKGLRSDVAKIENTQIFDHYKKRTEWFPEWGVIYREYQEAITKPFKEKFGSLFLKNGEIDFEALERLNPNSKEFRTFLKSTKDIRNPEIQAGIDGAINQAKEVYAKIKEYRGEIEKYVQETFGEFGSSFTDSIISAVERGGNAFENFGQTVARVMKNLIKQMLVTNDVKKIFDKFQKDMEEVYASSVGLSNEQIYEKVKNKTVDFVNNILKPEIQKGEQKAKAMFDALEQSGVKMYDEQGRRAAEKGYMRMSQDTGNDLLGQFRLQTQLSAEIKNATLQTANFIREMHQSMQTNAAQQLRHLAGIEANTYKLNKMETDLAGIKRGIDELTTKGIKLKS